MLATIKRLLSPIRTDQGMPPSVVNNAIMSRTARIKMTRDGVFIAEDVQKNKDEEADVPADLASVFIKRGWALRV